MASRSIRLSQREMEKVLFGRGGRVERVLAGFAGQVTKEVKDEMRSRAGGAWWPTRSFVDRGTAGARIITEVQPTRRHTIVPKSANVLAFKVGGTQVFARRVNHPGSKPPVRLIRRATARAGRRLR